MKTPCSRLAAEGVWEKVMSLLGDCQESLLLDAPAGAGIFSKKLRDRGAMVVSLDIRSNQGLESGQTVLGNMNHFLPFKNCKYDIIICIEGIEHLENPHLCMREFSRVLKQGGILIVTTPNILNLRSRLKFFLTGCPFWFGSQAAEKYGHVTPLTGYQVEFMATEARFKIIRREFNRKLQISYLFSWFFKLFAYFLDETHNDGDTMSGEILILKMEKMPG